MMTGGGLIPPPHTRGRMKTVKMVLTGKKKPIADGIGGKHADGAVVSLPDAIADQFVASKLAVFVDGSSSIEAAAANKVRRDEAVMAQRKAMAMRAMQIHDNLPADVRSQVHEAGDEATERYLAHLSSIEGDDVDAAPVKRKRGRPRKHLQ